MSIFQRLLDRLFPSKEQKALIAGLDASGKTTFLYKAFLHGEVVTTIPTIGFNVETLVSPTKKGTLNITCWDVGGCDKIRPLLRHYLNDISALIYIIDSTDRERFVESMDLLHELTTNLAEPVAGEKPGGPKHPVLIMANKRDEPNTIHLNEIESRCASIIKERPYHVFPSSMKRPLGDSGIPEALEWLQGRLRHPTAVLNDTSLRIQTASVPRSSLSFPLNSPEAIAQKLESYLSRAEHDSPPDLFLKQFNELELPSWDHYTHLRLAFVILTTFGRQKGKNMIFDGIQNYIANSKQATGRHFHLTMTHFWIQIVHFGVRSMPPLISLTGEAKGISGNGVGLCLVGPADFAQFLLMNPYLADGALWADYYSKEVMMLPKAKDDMALPDKKPLPNLVVRETIRSRS